MSEETTSEGDESLHDDIQEVQQQISDEYDVEDDEIREYLVLYRSHGVTGDDARKAAITKVANARGVERSDVVDASSSGSNELLRLQDFDDGVWGDARVTVVDKWESKSDAVAQKGLIDDGHETRVYTVWSRGTDNIPEFEEGQSYQFNSAVGSYNEEMESFEVQLNKSSSVTELDEELETSRGEIEFTGAFVGTQGKSGLVFRDTETGEVVESKNVDNPTEHDLRLILALDNGEEVYRAHFDQELTEELTGITMDEAKEIAMDSMDRTAVINQEMLPELIGRYVNVVGENQGEYIYVDEFEWADQVDEDRIAELRTRAEAIN